VIREGERYARDGAPVVWYAVGNKARNATKRMKAETALSESLSAADKLGVAKLVAERVSDDFTSGKISEVVLVSSKLVSVMVQRPEVRPLLPIAPAKREAAAAGPRAAVEFAPSPEAVLTLLLPKYLEFTIFSAMLETDAAFFSAQLIAMSNATDNAGKLLDDLTLAMNKARQGAITTEMLEIISGAEAQAG
jgi:F-type H+-transporting ATPase subunit gamma